MSSASEPPLCGRLPAFGDFGLGTRLARSQRANRAQLAVRGLGERRPGNAGIDSRAPVPGDRHRQHEAGGLLPRRPRRPDHHGNRQAHEGPLAHPRSNTVGVRAGHRRCGCLSAGGSLSEPRHPAQVAVPVRTSPAGSDPKNAGNYPVRAPHRSCCCRTRCWAYGIAAYSARSRLRTGTGLAAVHRS
jgi:hypothetical protein